VTEMSDSKRERWTPHNPLGMIALFVFLIETVATVSLHTIVEKPAALILVWFIVLYPIAIAATFFLLLWYKREALYGPGDLPEGEFSRLLLEVKDEANTFSTKQMYYSLGVSSRLHKEWKDARVAFQKAFDIDPHNTSALLGLADTAVDEARETQDSAKRKALLEDAVHNSNEAIRIEPTFATSYFSRAIANAMLKVESQRVREDLEYADHLDRKLREFIAAEVAFQPLHEHDWFRSRFLSTKEKGA